MQLWAVHAYHYPIARLNIKGLHRDTCCVHGASTPTQLRKGRKGVSCCVVPSLRPAIICTGTGDAGRVDQPDIPALSLEIATALHASVDVTSVSHHLGTVARLRAAGSANALGCDRTVGIAPQPRWVR